MIGGAAIRRRRRVSGAWVLVCLCLLCLDGAHLGAEEAERSLSLKEVLALFNTLHEGGTTFRWDPVFQSGVFSLRDHQVSFLTNTEGTEGLVLIDHQELMTPPTPYMRDGQLWFPPGFVAAVKEALDGFFAPPQLARPATPPAEAPPEEERFRIAAIIVDPGHGGKDSGAMGNHVIHGKPLKVVEKDITLRVAQLLYAQLVKAFPDKQILLTRNSDTYPSLEERVAIANAVPLKANEAVVFISVHANASFNKTVRGYEVWYLKPEYRRDVIDRSKYANAKEVIDIYNAMLEEEFTTESIMMAQDILKSLDETVGKDMPARGIKAEEWFVVRNARMPSVLVELGFVSNETDATLMSDDVYLKKFSEALYKGIRRFVGNFEQSGGFVAIE